MSGQEDAEDSRRRYGHSYSPHHTIPTIQKYLHEKEERKQRAASGNVDGGDAEQLEPSRTEQAKDYVQNYWQSESEKKETEQQRQDHAPDGKLPHDEDGGNDAEDYDDEEPVVDTTEGAPMEADAKQHRKGMKKRKDERAEREVTDPITHLPVTIHDYTSQALKEVPENAPPMGATTRSATGVGNKTKSNQQLQKERTDMEKGQESMQALFPPPEYAAVRDQIATINMQGMIAGLVGTVVIMFVAVALQRLLEMQRVPKATAGQGQARFWTNTAVGTILIVASLGSIVAVFLGLRGWVLSRIQHAWDDHIWEANRASIRRSAKAHEMESVAWLNSLMSSVWPLVNPDMFTSLADTLEDVMQASLPRIVQMVSVDDVGQGSESIRILGIRWLPTGAAARSVAQDGNLKPGKGNKHESDRTVPGEGDMDNTQVAEGMEAEEGDFINVEIAFAYRARSSGKLFKDRAKDMHLYLAFYLPGKLKIPVWVDVRGVVGTLRARLQLSPDPPFFALCTLTFLGQPKVDLNCFPLIKHGFNIMDLPLISNFVQSSVDAAMSQYVAPKSLTLDLKDMLSGDDFKKDTAARGILVVQIKRGYDFRTGDPGIPLIKQAGADPYVSVGWAKFGKPMWSTRVLTKEMEPCWEETAYLLVTPEELNVDERLRVQLWDSDRYSADDDLGRIELDLKQLMKGPETNCHMQHRSDGFRALKGDEDMPGKLDWSVGYFSKTRIQKCQLEQQTYDPDVRTVDQLEEKVKRVCERKMREAAIKEGREQRDKDELKQQEAQEMKARQDAMIISAPPPEGYNSGIFSIQIHQITGLEFEHRNKEKADAQADDFDEDEEGDQLPSAYCTVIVNHEKVFKTRTKPKNAKPFYNAGVERFIPDWQNAEVYLSVRDKRIKEDDPLLGIVHLPLGEVFSKRSQVNGFYPLMGGIGYGRVRISMVWRSVQLQAPPQDLGWSCGTLEVQSGVSAVDLPSEYQSMKLRFHTDLSYAKMYPSSNGEGAAWEARKQQSLKLPVKRRYQSCLAVEFRKTGLGKGKTGAFAILWLREVADEKEAEMEVPVYTGDFQRARATCIENAGDRVGSIKLKLTFWSGLGGAHSEWAKKDPNMHDVVDVLEVAREELESHQTAKRAGILDDTDDGLDSINSGALVNGHAVNDTRKAGDDDRGGKDVDGDGEKSKTTVLDSARDYKKHMQSSHRRHRGLMQWKIPRTMQWGVHKAENTGHRLSGLFKHHGREPGVETEV
ncbi:hypothetical protein BAUCODRAFT_80682 [Baudoinia panamericana UAMH 10762]|uniref:C2 domain-containing protein n=1 Tax=Baudoinia panamericana (strain UAMH 10762) TaxID=717646 RepID=M2MJ27_BAUPA|nr:uncharacterized protein BAUCODRAFT_80682 [Baudoinia panamericana UAMH 10762]EMC91278.1 hypothetical protein BAUCODRAFT_80682 [Baudoinia panamericana UAMH 10762]